MKKNTFNKIFSIVMVFIMFFSNLPYEIISRTLTTYQESKNIVDKFWNIKNDNNVVDNLDLFELAKRIQVQKAYADPTTNGTTWYLSNTNASTAFGTAGPTAEYSGQTDTTPAVPTLKTTALAMTDTPGTSAVTKGGVIGTGNTWFRTFLSPKLAAQTIASGMTFNLKISATESSTSANAMTRTHVYVWRQGTGFISTLIDGTAANCVTALEYATTGNGRACTTGAAAAATLQNGDQIAVEVWVQAVTGYTENILYGGPTFVNHSVANTTPMSSFGTSRAVVLQTETDHGTTWFLSNTNAATAYGTTGPAAEYGGQTDITPAVPTNKSIALAMTDTPGTSAVTVGGVIGTGNTWYRTFLSPKLAAQSIASGMIFNLNLSATESSASANAYTRLHVYVWRQGTGFVSTLIDGGAANCVTALEYGTTGNGRSCVTGAAAAATLQNGDQIAVEVWVQAVTGYTENILYGGPTFVNHSVANTTPMSSFQTSKVVTLQAAAGPTVTLSNFVGGEPGNFTIAPGASAQVDSFGIVASAGTDTLTNAVVTMTTGMGQYISNVALTNDGDTVTYCNAAPSGDTATFTGCTLPVTTTNTQFKVRLTAIAHTSMPAPVGAEYAITGRITSFTTTGTEAGSDAGSSTTTIDNLSPGGTLFSVFGTDGVITGDAASNVAQAIAKDSTYMYVVGYTDTTDWRIEKRLLSTGALDSGFGTSGVITGAAASTAAYAIAIDATYMYVAGIDSTNLWRIEKRLLTTGAIDSGFGTSGVITGAAASWEAYAIAIDSTYMYVAGLDGSNNWRIEKRLLSTGAVDSGFGTSGVITGATTSYIARAIAIDSTYMYVVGYTDTLDWRIEKRYLSSGALISGFGTSGVITGDAASTAAVAIALDSTYMYVAGNDVNFDWRIEKRLLSTGAVDSGFGTSGVITGAAASTAAYAIAIDSIYMYVGGDDGSSPYDSRIEKRLLSTGAVDSGFGTSGVITGVTTSAGAYAIAIDATSMYVAGFDNSDWRIEKRLLSTGAAEVVVLPTATAGDAQVSLTWPNPDDADFQQAYIYCKTSPILSGDTPAEGTDPTVDGAACDGTARLKYIGTSSPQTITGLTNGTYYFRIYFRDYNGNFTAYASTQEVNATLVATSPSLTTYTNSTETGLNYADSCTLCGARIGGGTGFRQSVTITGTNFGTDPGAGNYGTDTNNIKIGTHKIASANVTAWSDTSITFLTDSATTGDTDTDWGTNFGGATALTVTAGNQTSATGLNFYVFPQVTSITQPSGFPADGAREYDAGDTDGIITINGTRFGTAEGSGSATILGSASTTNSWSNTAIEAQVPTAIADTLYTGDVVVTQGTGGNSKIDTYTGFRILPRITSLNPTNGLEGVAVTVNGDHFCQSGTCPGSFNPPVDQVTFTSGVVATTFTSWSDTAIVTAVPVGAVTGDVVVSSYNGAISYTSNNKSFTVDANTTTLTTGTDPTATIIAPGAAITDVDRFTLQTNGGTETISSITVNLSTNSGVGTLTIMNNTNVTTYGSLGGGTGSSIVTGSNVITVTGMSATTSLVTYKVRVTPLSHADMPAPPGAGYLITAPVTSWAGGNTHTGSDTNTQALTIDNLSPGGTTGATATPGDAQIQVSWTNPGDAGFQKVLIYCKTSTITDYPTEGSDPSGNLSGCNETVAVKYSGATSPQTITGLSNGTTYYFRIYARDNRGNFTAIGSTEEVSGVPNDPPTISLNTADATNFGTDTTPTVEMTATDVNNDEINYHVQIASSPSPFLDRWVAVGNGTNSIAYSDNNGIAWTGVTAKTIFSTAGYAVAWNGSMFVAVGAGTSYTIATSPNGINWTGVPGSTSIFSTYGRGIAWNGTMWVAVGLGTNTIAYSYNGTDWNGVSNTIFTSGTFGGKAIGWNGTMWVAGGGSGTNSIAYSYNGIDWTGVTGTTMFTSYGGSVAWNGSLWVMVGAGGHSVARSSNGIDWTYGSMAILNGFGVMWSGDKFVAVGQSTNTIAYSSDGVYWSGEGITVFSTYGLGAAWNGSTYVAVGAGTNSVVYSSNGTNWNSATNIFSTAGYGVASTTPVLMVPAIPLTNKHSGLGDSLFVNTITGGDTAPFNSGEKVSYTVQSGEALSPGTYYWRARAIDPNGSNTYSSWTTARSFIVESSAPIITTYTNTTETGLNYADSCTLCGARIGGGSGFRQSITITGTSFGTDPGAGNYGTDTNNIKIGTHKIASANVTAWSDTSITFLTDSATTGDTDTDWGANFGGETALTVTAGNQTSATGLNFYIFPQVTSITQPAGFPADSAREYDDGDTDGIITINGTRFGTAEGSGSVTILGSAGTTTSWGNTAITVQIPTAISDSTYTGSIVMTQGTGGNSKTSSYNPLRILPRITSLVPSSGGISEAMTVNGNHLCQAGSSSCPTSFTSDKVIFTSSVVATTFTSWSNTAIVTAVPTGAVTGNLSVTSDAYTSNNSLFTLASAIPNNPTSLGQFKDGAFTQSISTGGMISTVPLYLKMSMEAGLSGGTLYPQVEYKLVGTSFTCTTATTCASAVEGTGVAGPGPTDGSKSISPASDGSYHWQARTKHTKNATDYYSAWVSYGENGEEVADFIIDRTPPAITNVSSGTPGTNGATITWDTAGELSTSQVQYNSTGATFVDNCATNGDCTTITNISPKVNSHSVTLSNLNSGTTYYFRVRSKDGADNEIISDNGDFTTQTEIHPAKTTEKFINGATGSINSATTYYFTVDLPEVSLNIKDAYIEVLGLVSGGFSGTITVQGNSANAREYEVSTASGTPTLYKFAYPIPSPNTETNLNLNDESPCTNGSGGVAPCNKVILTPSTGSINVLSTKIITTYSYTP